MNGPEALIFGVVGLGRIGGGLAQQALSKGLHVAGFDLEGASESLRAAGLRESESLQGLPESLPAGHRIIFLYVHAGPTVDEVIRDLLPQLSPGDMIVDGGNSYWGDSIRRASALDAEGIGFVDLGTSGGLIGAQTGACFMAGGKAEHVQRLEPILRHLSVEGGYVHAGPSGAGHFVKLVHNGIEFGMLQAIGEGVALLEEYHEILPIADVLRCWRNGSVIRSWLVDLMEEAYRLEKGMSGIPAYVEDTGEVNWLVADALKMEVPIPVIAQSIWQLFASRDETGHADRAIAMMRRGFGGHPYGPLASIAEERRTAQVGETFRPPYGAKSND